MPGVENHIALGEVSKYQCPVLLQGATGELQGLRQFAAMNSGGASMPGVENPKALGEFPEYQPNGQSYISQRFVKADARAEVFSVVSAGSRPALCSGMHTTRSSQARKKVT